MKRVIMPLVVVAALLFGPASPATATHDRVTYLEYVTVHVGWHKITVEDVFGTRGHRLSRHGHNLAKAYETYWPDEEVRAHYKLRGHHWTMVWKGWCVNVLGTWECD